MIAIRVLLVDCGLSESIEIAQRLKTDGVELICPADARSALENMADIAPDFVVLLLRGAPGKWLYRLRQVAFTLPIVLLCDDSSSPSDILQMVAAGASSVLKTDVHPDLIFAAYKLASEGYLVAPTPLRDGVRPKVELERMRLTAREIEILEHVAQGKTNAQIAKDLFLAEVTVRNHLANIFKKTGFKNRTSAGMAFVLADRLTTPDKQTD